MVYYLASRGVHNHSVHRDEELFATGANLSDGIVAATSVSDVPLVSRYPFVVLGIYQGEKTVAEVNTDAAGLGERVVTLYEHC